MDERSFQQELQSIKQRVAVLSLPNSLETRWDDPFARSLGEVNSMLDSMEERLVRCKANLMYARPPPPLTRTDLGPASRMTSTGAMSLDGTTQSSLPSSPSFWEHSYRDLTVRFLRLEDEYSSLASTVSQLEDRVDSLDPKCQTPNESQNGSNYDAMDAAGSKEACPFTWLPRSLPLPCANNNVTPITLNTEMPLSLSNFDAQLPEVLSSQSRSCVQPLSRVAYDILADSRRSDGELQLRADRQHRVEPWTMNTSEPARDSVPATPEQVYTAKPADMIPSPRSPASMDGVRFRDRELARMVDRLRMNEDRLKACENAMAEDQMTIARLRLEREEYRAVARRYRDRNHQLKDCIQADQARLANEEAKTRELEITRKRWVDLLQESEASRETFSRSHELFEARLQARSYEINKMKERMDSELEMLRRDHDVELKRLRNKCTSRNRIIAALKKDIEHLTLAARGTSVRREHLNPSSQPEANAREDSVDGRHARNPSEIDEWSRCNLDRERDTDLIDTESREDSEGNESSDDFFESAQAVQSNASTYGSPNDSQWNAGARRPYPSSRELDVEYLTGPLLDPEQYTNHTVSSASPGLQNRGETAAARQRTRVHSPHPQHVRVPRFDFIDYVGSPLNSTWRSQSLSPRRIFSESDLRTRERTLERGRMDNAETSAPLPHIGGREALHAYAESDDENSKRFGHEAR